MAESEKLLIVTPKWLKEKLREAAALKGVTMSEYVKDLIKEAVKRDLDGVSNCLLYTSDAADE